MAELAGRVAVVTGAAGNLGAAVARALDRAAATVVAVDRRPDRLRTVLPEIAGSPSHLPMPATDLVVPEQIDRMVAQTLERFSRIDILINCAGGFRGGTPVHKADLDDWEAMMAVNLRPTLLCCRAMVPVMLRQGRGRIVNVAAGAARIAPAGLAAYAAAKSAVLRLTEALAAELKGTGVTANAVLPGTIDTPQNRLAMPDADSRHWVAPAAIADVILFLASDGARAINGAALPVSGA